MAEEEEPLSIAQTASKLVSFYDAVQPLGDMNTLAGKWVKPIQVGTPSCDFSLFCHRPRDKAETSVARNKSLISREVSGMPSGTIVVRVCFGIQTTAAIHKRSIEMPIMVVKCSQYVDIKNALGMFCKLRPLVLEREVKNVKFHEEVSQNKFFFSTDRDLTKSINIGRPQWKCKIPFEFISLPWRTLQDTQIAKFSQLEYWALGEAEKRVTKELSYLKQVIPRSVNRRH